MSFEMMEHPPAPPSIVSQRRASATRIMPIAPVMPSEVGQPEMEVSHQGSAPPPPEPPLEPPCELEVVVEASEEVPAPDPVVEEEAPQAVSAPRPAASSVKVSKPVKDPAPIPALGGLRAPAKSAVDFPYPAFSIMQSSEMVLSGGGVPHDAEVAAYIGTTSNEHSFDTQLLAAADGPSAINPSALRKAAFALGLGGGDKRPKLKPLLQRPHTSSELAALRALETATAAANAAAAGFAAGATAGGIAAAAAAAASGQADHIPSFLMPSPSKLSPRQTSRPTHPSPERSLHSGPDPKSRPPSLSTPSSSNAARGSASGLRSK